MPAFASLFRRPAELFRFRRAVLRAKATAGVALPTLRPAP
jgi:hypothetical protein